MNLTAQQNQIIEAVKTGKNIKIKAGAGSGKSSTLRFIAESIPEKNFLCLCFNKKNADESNTFLDKPKNIIYSTCHSIAYKAIMPSYRGKKLFGLLKEDISQDIIDNFLVDFKMSDLDKKTFSFLVKTEVISMVTIFCFGKEKSLKLFLNLSELGEGIQDFFKKRKTITKSFIYKDYNTEIYYSERGEIYNSAHSLVKDLTIQYWDKLLNPSIKNSISHDVYLKLFQIQERKLFEISHNKETFEVDVLMGDEFQDTTECVLDIFENQTHLQKIAVGDSSQQLYDWRGAIDAISLLDYETLYLTQSFRFNSTIANLANKVLKHVNSEILLEGVGQHADISEVFLSRTNFNCLKTIYELSLEDGLQYKINFIYTPIDIKNLFSKLFHLEAVYFNNIPKYPCKEFSYITNKNSLLENMKTSEEISGLINISRLLSASFGSLYNASQKMKEVLTDNPDADIKVSTIHKFKGLEAGIVYINDDIFPKKLNNKEEFIPDLDAIKISEYNNLLYVAITRAKNKVILPGYLSFLY